MFFSDLPPTGKWVNIGVGYNMINEFGDVCNALTGNLKRTSINREGKVIVHLLNPEEHGKQYNIPVAKLVLIAFVGHDLDITKTTPLHLDGDLTNCHLSNLEWSTLYTAKRYYQNLQLS